MASTRATQNEPGRYLYERLSEKRFQELCNALLVSEYGSGQVQCFPVGQSDGGRDAVRKQNGRVIVYQVKWAKKAISSPVAWLDGAIKGESDKIRRLVANGASEYILLTSLPGTAVPGRGTMDQLDAVLKQYSDDFGIPMHCWWRADIDARVDNAPRELKWTYSDMLAGNELIRYLIEADRAETHLGELQDLLLKVVAAQELEDARVKFKRVDLDVYNLADLFVDVEAERLTGPSVDLSDVRATPEAAKTRLGGAAHYLLNTARPFTLVIGEPGQGKSTLGQYVCQVHRHALLPGGDTRLLSAAPPNVRVPLRIDLRDYAAWLGANESIDGITTASNGNLNTERSLEQFLVPFTKDRSGGLPIDIQTTHEILQRFPVLIVLDGLDEVARPDVRQRVVAEIDSFSNRLRAGSTSAQVIVTTRPNSSGLAEPSRDLFESIALAPLTSSLRTTYLRKWADANHVQGTARRALERTFRERSAEPHIALLADNPMQLTILLYLIHKRGDSVPTGRTSLYTSYMETLLDREGEKTKAVVDHRPELEEVTAYLGWHLQSLAESKGGNGTLSIRELKKAILDYLFDVEKETSLVDALFTTVTDRVWALTSKIQGTFEFDVQPVREYFAAKFLHDFAGADNADFDASDVLRELVRRAYWLNTTRFFVGFATPNELAGFVGGLAEEFAQSDRPRQVRSAAWTLLADGVFAGRTRAQRQVVQLLADDLSLILLLGPAAEQELARPVRAHGLEQLVETLRAGIESDPNGPLSSARFSMLQKLDSDRATAGWWHEHMLRAIGTPTEQAWLRLAELSGAGSQLSEDEVARLDLSPAALPSILNAGVIPKPGSELEKTLLRATLNGQLSDANPELSSGYPGDLLRLVAPAVLFGKANLGAPYAIRTGHESRTVTDSRRTSAIGRLRKRNERFTDVQSALRFNRGEKGSTFPWANTAKALSAIFGPCWLAADIAVAGAAIDRSLRTGGSQKSGAEAFGPTADYGALLLQLRSNSNNTDWWARNHSQHGDALSRGIWVLGLLCVADESVVRAFSSQADSALTELSDEARRAILASSSRIGASGLGRRIATRAPQAGESLLMSTLLSHHSIRLSTDDHLEAIPIKRLAEMAQFDLFAWPALRAITARLAARHDTEALAGLRAFGHRAQVDVPATFNDLSETAEAVLRDPTSYPANLVLAIELALSRSASDASLAAAAGAGHWFGPAS